MGSDDFGKLVSLSETNVPPPKRAANFGQLLPRRH
jgi:hypothetical protein